MADLSPNISGTPTVAVVIPCYNHGRFVGEAVASCLRQEGADIRVVVVNDGSTDAATPGQCDACIGLDPGGGGGRVRVVHQPNRGLPAARNRGAAEADTWAGEVGRDHEYLVFLDADDWIEPTFVTKLHDAIIHAERDPSSVSAGPVTHAYCQERLVELGSGVWAVPEWDTDLLLITNLHPVTALVRTAWFRRVGGFDETMREGYEDWDFWLKLASAAGGTGRGVRVREPLFVWRRHSAVTMVIEAVARHESLYRRLVENHRALYQQRMPELLIRSNVLLRNADANWLDENLEAIVVRDLRRGHAERAAACERLQQERERLAAALEAARREREALREQYEAKPVVRLSKKVHELIDRMPGPLRNMAHAGINGCKQVWNRT